MIKKLNKGFTLIEAMLLIVIIAILAAIVIPVFTGKAEKTEAVKVFNAMRQEHSKDRFACPLPETLQQKDPELFAGVSDIVCDHTDENNPKIISANVLVKEHKYTCTLKNDSPVCVLAPATESAPAEEQKPVEEEKPAQ